MDFFNRTRMVVFFLLAMIIAVVCFNTFFGVRYSRLLLYFENEQTGEIETEVRYLSNRITEDKAVQLVTELILGPVNYDFLPFMEPTVISNSCFVRDDALYLDLPITVLNPSIKTSEFFMVFQLFKKNIFTNCKNIDKLYMSLDGKQVYEDIE